MMTKKKYKGQYSPLQASPNWPIGTPMTWPISSFFLFGHLRQFLRRFFRSSEFSFDLSLCVESRNPSGPFLETMNVGYPEWHGGGVSRCQRPGYPWLIGWRAPLVPRHSRAWPWEYLQPQWSRLENGNYGEQLSLCRSHRWWPINPDANHNIEMRQREGFQGCPPQPWQPHSEQNCWCSTIQLPCSSPNNPTWRLPEMKVTPNHPLIDGVFPDKTSILGYPMAMETPAWLATMIMVPHISRSDPFPTPLEQFVATRPHWSRFQEDSPEMQWPATARCCSFYTWGDSKIAVGDPRQQSWAGAI